MQPIKFYINEKNWLIAVFPDGREFPWGSCETARGAKCRLTYHAKRYGLTVNGTIAE